MRPPCRISSKHATMQSGTCSRKGMCCCMKGMIPSCLSCIPYSHPLCVQRFQLDGHEIDFPDYDLLEQHEPLRLYTVSPWGHVLEFRAKRPSWAIYLINVSAPSRSGFTWLTPSRGDQFMLACRLTVMVMPLTSYDYGLDCLH